VNETPEFRRLGPYLLVRTSGTGGMGHVELALRSEGDSSEVCVIKRMHADGRDDEHEARFRREAQIAARLDHPNIARTLRVEEVDGEICLAQEFVEGVDLGRLMSQCRPQAIPVDVGVHLVLEVCQALGYAHDFGGLGIVHRDVTPENVMISFVGEVKLIDFGIARSAVDGTVTNVGVVMGRREYIAPEAWEGDKPDRRVDLYAVGVVLWELLTGLRLAGSSEVGPGKQLPNPCTVNPAIPGELGEITAHALAAAPGDRFQSAEDMRLALAPFAPANADGTSALVALLGQRLNVDLSRALIAEDVAAARRVLDVPDEPPRSPSRRTGAAIAAIAALATAVVGIAFVRRPSRPATPPPAPATVAVQSPAPALAPRPGDGTPVHATVAVPVGEEASHLGRGAPTLKTDRRPRRDLTPAAATTPAVEPSPGQLVRDAQDRWDRGDAAAAKGLLRRARAAGAGAPAHVVLGAILMSENALPEAERELAEAVRLEPGDTQAKNLLAVVREKIAERGSN
jgi:hypothetical protein